MKDAGNSGNSNESNDPNGGQADDSEKGTADENTGAVKKQQCIRSKKQKEMMVHPKNGTDGTASANSSQAKNSQSDEVVEASAVPSSSTNGSDGVYVVEKGDTLAIISEKNVWRCHAYRCNLQDEWIIKWQSDLHRAEIAIALKTCYTYPNRDWSNP